MSGDVVPVMSTAEARERIDRVRGHVRAAWPDLIALYQGQAWESVGYTSWEALCRAEFQGAAIALPREERREAVAELTEAGLSTRAIAAAVGVHHSTVADDQAAGVGNPTPGPVQGLDGKTYTRAPVVHITDAGEVPDEEVQEILDRFIDDDTEVQRARINRRIADHAAALSKVCLTDPDDIAAGDPDAIASLTDSIEAVNRWADKVRAATTTTRTLRVITQGDTR